MIFEKVRSCFWKLKLGFLTNGLISPLPKALSSNYPKLVFIPRSQMSRLWDLKVFSCQAPQNFASNKLLFSNFGSFLTKLWMFIPRKLQKALQKSKKLKKWAHSEILSLRAFKWCKNQIILTKFQFWPTSL